jgi:transcriptional regulator with GAF, ATPase, and Fis domain
MPIEVQVKLLRVLQEHEFERVGSTTPIKTDVRIIAATNRDLLKAMKEGSFREDLYFRLNVFPIHLPPIRERKEDIPLLAKFLIDKFATRIGNPIAGIGADTMRMLMEYAWPGNVRELENILERAVILASAPILEIDAVALGANAPRSAPNTPASNTDLSLESVERNHILSTLRASNWVIDGQNGAAGMLGLHPNTLRSRLKKLGISRRTHETS